VKGRPPKGSINVERWTGRRWIEDDGQPGLAFSYQDDQGFPFAIACDCDCPAFSEACPLERAMNRTFARWSCANGQSFEA